MFSSAGQAGNHCDTYIKIIFWLLFFIITCTISVKMWRNIFTLSATLKSPAHTVSRGMIWVQRTCAALVCRYFRIRVLREKYTFLPAELSSERGEREVLADSKQPTAPPSTKSHVSYCTARLAEERKWRPKVHQARRDDRFSSRFLSLLLTAAIVPTRPTPLLLRSPLPLSLRPGLMHSKM